jgi:hypothetical protein
MGMNYRKIRLLEQQDKAYFMDCVDELYRTIACDASFEILREQVKYGKQKDLVVRMLSKLTFLDSFKFRLKNAPIINFAAMISGDFKLMLPYSFFTSMNFIYMYDAWPRFHKWIFPLLDFFNIRFVFFSSKQVYLDHQTKYPGSRCKSIWLPEGINTAEYRAESYVNKDIDVLEFGRIYQEYHDLIKGALITEGKKHVYPKPGVALLFPDRPSFIDGLAQSKIVICVPSNITHPQRAEYISTMTLRYLQAMASKVLIVGKMPNDMQELFTYLPILEIDMDHAAEQILDILRNYEAYIPLIERNYVEVWENHQWQNRWGVIRRIMEECDE